MPPKPAIQIRRPGEIRPPDPAQVDQFVAGGPPALSLAPTLPPAAAVPAPSPERPPEPPPAAGPLRGPEAAMTTPDSPAPDAPDTPPRRGIVARKRGPERRRTTVYLDPGLAVRLSVYCAQHQRDLSDCMGEALEAWLERH